MRTILTRFRTFALISALLVAFAPLFTAAAAARQGFTTGTRYFWVSPGNCNTSFSGGGAAAGTNGMTTAGASATPVIQRQTDNVSTNTHLFVCNITPPGFPVAATGSGWVITDATFYYGVQTTGLGTQVATLASGTMNSVIVFSSITYPTAAAGETASTVTPVRADSGTLTIAPVVASFNVATTTAGAFYSAKFTPAAGTLVHRTVNVQLLMTVALLNTATSATITNSPGILVHYQAQ